MLVTPESERVKNTLSGPNLFSSLALAPYRDICFLGDGLTYKMKASSLFVWANLTARELRAKIR